MRWLFLYAIPPPGDRRHSRMRGVTYTVMSATPASTTVAYSSDAAINPDLENDIEGEHRYGR
jgi:hypothetical protein